MYASSAKDVTNDRGVVDINVQNKNGIKLSFDMSASMLTAKYSFDDDTKKSNHKSNVFIPYYRQISFKYLMDNHKNLEEYFIKGGHKKYLKNMIAMYSIGFGVSKKWFEGLDKEFEGKDIIHFAKDENDTNCVISWNLESPNGGDGNTLLSEKK